MTFVAALPDGTLVSVGRLLDDRGSPSPAAWVSKPPVRPTATPVVTPAAGSGAQLGDSWVAAQMPVVVGRPVGRIEAVTAGGPGFVAVGRGCVNRRDADMRGRRLDVHRRQGLATHPGR